MKAENKSNLFFLIAFLIGTLSCVGQHHFHRGCATAALDSIKRIKNSDYDKSRLSFEKKLLQKTQSQAARTSADELIYSIPVVVHVIYSPTYPNSNIPDEEVLEQLEVLNQDFRRMNIDAINTPNRFKPFAADIKIQFCLATRKPDGTTIESAIIRKVSDRTNFDYERDDSYLKSLSYWPSDQYLNIWVTRLGGNVLGYAQYPDDSGLTGLAPVNGNEVTDGVVIDYRAFGYEQPAVQGTNSPYIYGRTLTHEVGHWLGLLHTFGAGTGCGTQSNDYVNDTPRLGKSNQGLNNCDTTVIGCGGDTAMFQNYMDYTNDRCMNLFTLGQKERMRTSLLTSPRRLALLNSPGCCGSGVAVFSPPYLQTFEDSLKTILWDDTSFASTLKWSIGTTSLGNSALAQSNSVSTGSMVSPFFNFSTTTTPMLTFDVAGNSQFETGHLKLFYELTCSSTWIEIKNIDTFSNDWESFDINLSPLYGQKYVRFRVEAKTETGEPIYFDNFKLYKSTSFLETFLYPNPSLGDVYLEVNFSGEHSIKLGIYTPLGQLMMEHTLAPTTSALLHTSFETLAAGTYFLKTEVNGDTKVNKFIIAK